MKKSSLYLGLALFALSLTGCKGADDSAGATTAPNDTAASKAIELEKKGASQEEINQAVENPANPMLEPTKEQPSNP